MGMDIENLKGTKPTLLWLDDLRDPFKNEEGRVLLTNAEIHWVKNAEEFEDWIRRNGLPDYISFDHDLGVEHYTPSCYWEDYQLSAAHQESKDYTEKTGHACAVWLTKYCLSEKCLLPPCLVHSANPVGAANIRGVLNSFVKFQRENPECYE